MKMAACRLLSGVSEVKPSDESDCKPYAQQRVFTSKKFKKAGSAPKPILLFITKTQISTLNS
ncbi:MAG: hypothetical protein IIV82_00625 [Ruminococcus sp.]|nr:hypothetical protein [Ruminococcus sp.]